MRLHIETELESDGRWIAEIASLPGVMTYGADKRAAVDAVKKLACQVLSEKAERGEIDKGDVTFEAR